MQQINKVRKSFIVNYMQDSNEDEQTAEQDEDVDLEKIDHVAYAEFISTGSWDSFKTFLKKF